MKSMQSSCRFRVSKQNCSACWRRLWYLLKREFFSSASDESCSEMLLSTLLLSFFSEFWGFAPESLKWKCVCNWAESEDWLKVKMNFFLCWDHILLLTLSSLLLNQSSESLIWERFCSWADIEDLSKTEADFLFWWDCLLLSLNELLMSSSWMCFCSWVEEENLLKIKIDCLLSWNDMINQKEWHLTI